MKGSLRIGQIAGIGVFVHWTFGILIVFIAFSKIGQEGGLSTVVASIASILAVFGCIVLHELGHALTARRFGIKTRDITLLPIGGVARLERMPEDPLQELWVALAGPAVNVVIAAILAIVLVSLKQLQQVWNVEPQGGHFLAYLLVINLFLAIFNLIPAFPMDGGRVLRAVLAWWRGDYVRATQIAAGVGQFIAVIFGLLGLMSGQFFLMFIALFVYLGAQEEAYSSQMRSVFKGMPVSQAMQTRFRALSPQDTLGVAVDELLAGSQQDFPVVEDGRVVGMLLRSNLLQALAERGRDVPIGQVMQAGCGTVSDTDVLQTTFDRMREEQCPCLPVVRNGELVGMITLENVGELMLIQSALGQNRARSHVENIYRHG